VLIARGRNTSQAARGFELDATYFYMFNFSGQALKVHFWANPSLIPFPYLILPCPFSR
jgi:hypothetical protein